MDFARFADIPVVDGHIHFPHPELMDDVLAVMEATRAVRANLVAVPDLQYINQNAALIHFKAHHPGRVYICGALDHTQVLSDPLRASQVLANQVTTLQAIGFDGLKLLEGKPTVRKLLDIPLDGPEYAGLWAALEEQGFPVIFHVADPGEFWDAARCPDWARARDWFYGDGTFPQKEELYAEIDRVLERHPGLRIIFAHFYFLSGDLERAGRFLDAHPHVCFDLTPGVEMYFDFTHDPDATRDFFVQYQERLVFGTDIGARALQRDPGEGLDRAESLGRAWIVRRCLETGEEFSAPEGVGRWLGLGADPFRGIALPPSVLDKVYQANFERVFGPAPACLDPDAALAELRRQVRVIDALSGGENVESPAHRVAHELAALVGD